LRSWPFRGKAACRSLARRLQGTVALGIEVDSDREEVGAGGSLDTMSLAMKGEVLPAQSHWRGIPARQTA